MLRSRASPGLCLAPGSPVQEAPDPWCAQKSNIWRSNTDINQSWERLMVEIESLVGLGRISRPGAWGFADALVLGLPGNPSITWEESKTHLALYAVTSQPLFLGNDVRPGEMQPRLLDLMLNPD